MEFNYLEIVEKDKLVNELNDRINMLKSCITYILVAMDLIMMTLGLFWTSADFEKMNRNVLYASNLIFLAAGLLLVKAIALIKEGDLYIK